MIQSHAKKDKQPKSFILEVVCLFLYGEHPT